MTDIVFTHLRPFVTQKHGNYEVEYILVPRYHYIYTYPASVLCQLNGRIV